MNTQFKATYAVLDERRTLILEYKGPEGRSLLLPITEVWDVRKDGLMSVCYDYHAPTETRPYAVIQLVAGPGISISVEYWPQQWQPSLEYPDLRIFRVQNPTSVPPIGATIRPSLLLLRYEEGSLGQGSATLPFHMPLSPPLRYAQITPFPEGLEIYHPGSSSILTLRIPNRTRKPDEAIDGKQRFSYRFHEDIEQPTPKTPLFTLLATTDVQIEIRDTRTRRRPTNDELYGLKSFYQLWLADVSRIDDHVQPSKEGGFRQVDELIPYSQEGKLSVAMMADLAVGAIPIVGDIADVGEFIYALNTGKDKWGFDVDALQLTLMGVFALVPFLSNSVARAARSGMFGRLSSDVPLVARQLRDAGFTRAEWKAYLAANKLLTKGKRLSPELQEIVAKGLRKLEGKKYRTLDDILAPSGQSFNHPLIQRFYEAAQERRTTKGEARDLPVDWIRKTRGNAQIFLQTTLGPEFQKMRRLDGGGHRIRTRNIPRPAPFRLRAVEEQAKVALKDRAALLERLGNSLREGQSGAPNIPREIKAGHFRILKGNVAEALSHELQLKYLKDMLRKHPDAMLVEGVYAQTTKASGGLSAEKLFSDNLIVRYGPRRRLEVLGVIEVKSANNGGLEAQLQIFEWNEGRIEDGARIVLGAGARRTGKGGELPLLSRKEIYVYKPDRSTRDVPEVLYLLSARRHVITAKGTSLLGLDSASQVATEVTRDELALTSLELDYLVGIIAEQLGLGLPY